MGLIIRFPEEGHSGRTGRLITAQSESATVIILPVIRIERYPDEPTDPETTRSQRRRRRRRVSRS